VGSHSTYVPDSTRKSHSVDILVLVHNAMYMAHTTLRLVFNFSSFPPKKFGQYLNLKLVPLNFMLHCSKIEVPFIKVLAHSTLYDLEMSNKNTSKYVR
jgi:hypothetical protein